jgi:hypothetical protein
LNIFFRQHYNDPLQDFKAYKNGQDLIGIERATQSLLSSRDSAKKTCHFSFKITEDVPECGIFVLSADFFFGPL